MDRHLQRVGNRTRLVEALRAASWTSDSRALELVLQQYGEFRSSTIHKA